MHVDGMVCRSHELLCATNKLQIIAVELYSTCVAISTSESGHI